MDPNTALKAIRVFVTHADLLVDGEHEQAFSELVDLVSGLDEWLTDGGFLPAAWQTKQA